MNAIEQSRIEAGQEPSKPAKGWPK